MARKSDRLFRVPFIGGTPKNLVRELKGGLKIYLNNEPELWRSAMYDYRDYAFELQEENEQLKKELEKIKCQKKN